MWKSGHQNDTIEPGTKVIVCGKYEGTISYFATKASCGGYRTCVPGYYVRFIIPGTQYVCDELRQEWFHLFELKEIPLNG